ncbi:MAG: TIGR02996 domain-containing protein [Kofleriaceae bacterium]
MSDAALIAAIVDDPDDESAWMVYADWLLSRGDPRGELIQIGMEMDRGNMTRRFRAAEIEGDEPPLLSARLRSEAKHWQLTWRRGFVEKARLMKCDVPRTDETLRALLADPHAALLRQLTSYELVAPLFEQTSRITHVLVNGLGDHAAMLERSLPELDSLTVMDAASVLRIAHRELGQLNTLLSRMPALATGAFELPALESLMTPPSAEMFDDRASIVHRPPPNLRDVYFNAGGNGLLRLVGTPLLAQLTVLTIVGIRIAELPAVEQVAGSFSHVKKLAFHFHGDDYVDVATCDAIERTVIDMFPGVETPRGSSIPDGNTEIEQERVVVRRVIRQLAIDRRFRDLELEPDRHSRVR